jgi:drug/metabolite transporter (DMT)-like permease
MSLSDATVLTFLAPTVTSAFGFLFLREAVSWKQAAAGRKSLSLHLKLRLMIFFLIVTSLAGVVLIARPTSLFGGSDRADTGAGAGGPIVTEAERMVAVGYVLFQSLSSQSTNLMV